MNRSQAEITIMMALLALGAWAGIAPAASQDATANQQSDQFSQPQPGAAGQQQVTGEITRLTTVSDPQTGQRRVVARVKTSGGDTIPVDLADPAGLQQADLERGQQITVSGYYGKVDGQRGLIASRLQDEQGFVVQVQRSGSQERQQFGQDQRQQRQEWQTPQGWQPAPRDQSQGWQRQSSGQEESLDNQWQPQAGWQGEQGWNAQADQQQRRTQQPSWQTRQQDQSRWLREQGTGGSRGQPQEGMAGVLVTGKLTDTREIQVQGQDQPFLLVKVVTREGRTVIANLGPRNRLPQNLHLQRGEQVAVTGELGRINNQPVIIAHTFANVVDLEPQWTEMSRQEQQNQQTSQRRAPQQQDNQQQDNELDMDDNE